MNEPQLSTYGMEVRAAESYYRWDIVYTLRDAPINRSLIVGNNDMVEKSGARYADERC